MLFGGQRGPRRRWKKIIGIVVSARTEITQKPLNVQCATSEKVTTSNINQYINPKCPLHSDKTLTASP